MARSKSSKSPAPQPILELEDFAVPAEEDPGSRPARPTRRLMLRATGTALTLVILSIAAFELTHYGKIYPGVVADGLNLGGMSQAAAAKALARHSTTYAGQVVTITEGSTNLRIPVKSLEPSYDATLAAKRAYEYGRQGSLGDKTHAKARAAMGKATAISTFSFDGARLIPYLTSLIDDTVTPVKNAQLAFNDNRSQVTPAVPGKRLNIGLLYDDIIRSMRAQSDRPIALPLYQIHPTLSTSQLAAAVGQINNFVSAPITLAFNGTSRQIDQATITTWINVAARPNRPFLTTRRLEDLFPTPPAADLGLSQPALAGYVAQLAQSLDQTPQNATLAMQDGKLAVTVASRTGMKLDQAATVAGINNSLKSSGNRTLELKLATTQADVNENNLESLGIKEQLSQGETYFPGSPSTRLTNVRAGAKRFNGVLLKPGETFSFGALLGAVGPEQGYVPELVILANHEEKQYGGGLCQVSSTAFRAALAAGLPITQRVNHSFAISYYTWPYAAPGVDATIYYPAVDFKFVNDTGHYILMQTIMSGYDLKFDFFGTKTKSGVVRGPTFISGNSDVTQPSHTRFYRDVLDLSGNVVKTDTFNTYYKSSKDFPILEQFN